MSDAQNCVVYHLDSVGGSAVVVAGVSGACAHSGADGTPSTLAGLARPVGLAAYSPVDFIVAEGNGNYVRRSTNGTIWTLVGTGAASSAGDGGPAVSASTNSPAAVRWDSTGAGYYVTEDVGGRVRYVNAAGIISTVFSPGSGVICAAPVGAGGL